MTLQSCPASLGDRVGDVVRRLLAERAINRPIGSRDDLRDAGLASVDMVSLVFSIEAEFDLLIPENEITLANFRSVSAIGGLVARLLNDGRSGSASG
jgi:acyl carrier protein